jgi:GT2 family glycosyltransferase
MPTRTAVSAVVINWNTRNELRRCLQSLERALPGAENEIIVVDNASRDGSAAMVTAEFPRAYLHANTVNRGFAGGINDGLTHASCDVVILMNPDIIVTTKTIGSLGDILRQHPELGAVTGVFRNSDGSRQRGYLRRKPTMLQTLLFETALAGWARRRRNLVDGYLEQSWEDGNEIAEIEQIPGAFVATRKDVLETVGGFDERFPLFFEDVDWSTRVRDAGFRLALVPGISVRHEGGKSFLTEDRTWLLGRYRASLLLYFDKHASRPMALTVRLIQVVNSSLIFMKKSVEIIFESGEARSRARIAREQHRRFLSLVFLPGRYTATKGLPA